VGGIGALEGPEPGADLGAREDATGGPVDPAFRFFARTPGGRPVRWNPCEPIRYEIDLGPMPRNAAGDIHESFERTGSATGIAFAFGGFVEVDVLDRLRERDFTAAGAGGELDWAPILVAWRPQQTLLDLGADRDVIGLGLPIATRLDRGQYVSGIVVLNADADLRRGFATGFDRGPLILHEIAHVIGLGHVGDRSSLMFRRSVGTVTGFGQGDLQGLDRLGVGAGCLVTPTPRQDVALVPPGLVRRGPHTLP
jgi:hypothetical protein